VKLADLITPHALSAYVRGETADDGPYSGQTFEQIDAQVQHLIGRLRDSAMLDAEGDFDSYGSGWASFVDIFCSRSHGASSRLGPPGYTITEGVRLYVSRLAPIAAFGLSELWRSSTGSSFNFLEPGMLNDFLRRGPGLATRSFDACTNATFLCYLERPPKNT
jgi:hypothetical protein